MGVVYWTDGIYTAAMPPLDVAGDYRIRATLGGEPCPLMDLALRAVCADDQVQQSDGRCVCGGNLPNVGKDGKCRPCDFGETPAGGRCVCDVDMERVDGRCQSCAAGREKTAGDGVCEYALWRVWLTLGLFVLIVVLIFIFEAPLFVGWQFSRKLRSLCGRLVGGSELGSSTGASDQSTGADDETSSNSTSAMGSSMNTGSSTRSAPSGRRKEPALRKRTGTGKDLPPESHGFFGELVTAGVATDQMWQKTRSQHRNQVFGDEQDSLVGSLGALGISFATCDESSEDQFTQSLLALQKRVTRLGSLAVALALAAQMLFSAALSGMEHWVSVVQLIIILTLFFTSLVHAALQLAAVWLPHCRLSYYSREKVHVAVVCVLSALSPFAAKTHLYALWLQSGASTQDVPDWPHEDMLASLSTWVLVVCCVCLTLCAGPVVVRARWAWLCALAGFASVVCNAYYSDLWRQYKREHDAAQLSAVLRGSIDRPSTLASVERQVDTLLATPTALGLVDPIVVSLLGICLLLAAHLYVERLMRVSYLRMRTVEHQWSAQQDAERELMAVAFHELRNPANAVFGYLSLAMNESDRAAACRDGEDGETAARGGSPSPSAGGVHTSCVHSYVSEALASADTSERGHSNATRTACFQAWAPLLLGAASRAVPWVCSYARAFLLVS